MRALGSLILALGLICVSEAEDPAAPVKPVVSANERAELAMREAFDASKEWRQFEMETYLQGSVLERAAAKARDAFMQKNFDLKRRDPVAWKRQDEIWTAYAAARETAEQEFAVAQLMVTAESEKVRMTQEQVDEAGRKVVEIRKGIPEGKGELFEVARIRFEKLNHYVEWKEVRDKETTGALARLRDSLRPVDRLSAVLVDEQFYPDYEKFGFELDQLSFKAQEAIRDAADDPQDLAKAEEADAARKRFDAAIAKEVTVKVTGSGKQRVIQIGW